MELTVFPRVVRCTARRAARSLASRSPLPGSVGSPCSIPTTLAKASLTVWRVSQHHHDRLGPLDKVCLGPTFGDRHVDRRQVMLGLVRIRKRICEIDPQLPRCKGCTKASELGRKTHLSY